MLIDEIDLTVKAGDGGDGMVSFGRLPKSGPDGGNGGDGADVYAVGIEDIMALKRYAPNKIYKAEDGKPGGRNKKTGKSGKGLILEFPVASTLIDKESGELLEIDKVGQKELICKGGKGGRGNWEFRSSTNTSPKYAEPGQPGEKRNIHIVLRLIADYGLIGLPSVGKSSLLNELTKAHVKTAAYHFTTLEPNLGALNGKIIADIPGLIAGASEGKGLGIKFLKHIEKVPVILHCVSADSDHPKQDYQTIRKELKEFNLELLDKKEVILLTKSDLVDDQELKQKQKLLSEYSNHVIPVSIHDWDSLQELEQLLTQ
jgi:GTP-binding protein